MFTLIAVGGGIGSLVQASRFVLEEEPRTDAR